MTHRKGYFESGIQKYIILSIRTLSGKNYQEVANAMGVSVRTLYYIKSGKSISVTTKKKIQSFLLKTGGKTQAKVSVLSEHYKRTGKTKAIKLNEAEKIFSRRKKRIKLLMENITNNSRLLYKELWY